MRSFLFCWLDWEASQSWNVSLLEFTCINTLQTFQLWTRMQVHCWIVDVWDSLSGMQWWPLMMRGLPIVVVSLAPTSSWLRRIARTVRFPVLGLGVRVLTHYRFRRRVKFSDKEDALSISMLFISVEYGMGAGFMHSPLAHFVKDSVL